MRNRNIESTTTTTQRSRADYAWLQPLRGDLWTDRRRQREIDAIGQLTYAELLDGL